MRAARAPQAAVLLGSYEGRAANSRTAKARTASSRETARRQWQRGLFGIRLLAAAPMQVPSSTEMLGGVRHARPPIKLGPTV